MKTSESIVKISAAIVAAQSEVKGAFKDGKNSFFKNAQGQATSYATLDSVIEAAREALAKHKLAVLQAPIKLDGEFYVETRIQHESGEFYEVLTPLLFAKQDMQAFGSAITYAKRYALGSLLNISTDGDDDGNSTVESAKQKVFTKTAASDFFEDGIGEYVISLGSKNKLTGTKIKDHTPQFLLSQVDSLKSYSLTTNKPLTGSFKEFVDVVYKLTNS